MTDFTRRALVKGATAAAAAGALAGPALLEWAKAWAQTAPWKPEKNAQLAMLRWKYFVQAEDDAFVVLLDAFTKATGVEVSALPLAAAGDLQTKITAEKNNPQADAYWANEPVRADVLRQQEISTPFRPARACGKAPTRFCPCRCPI